MRAWLLLALGLALGLPAAERPPDDPWTPWRRPARLLEAPFTELPVAPRLVPLPEVGGVLALPWSTTLAEYPLDEQAGVAVDLRLQLGRVPPLALPASHSLARLVLRGENAEQSVVLHAYARRKGFLLNGLYHGREWPRVWLARGAAVPGATPALDTAWHTLTLAWCHGQLAALWDGVPVLHVGDPAIAYRELTLEWVRPGPDFQALRLEPLAIRPVRFVAVR